MLLPFNGLCLVHTRRDAERLLESVRNHLSPEGHFILDVNNPRLERLAGASSTELPFAKYEFDEADGAGGVVATRRRRYDRATQILSVDITYEFSDGKKAKDQLLMKMYFPQEVRALLHYNGYRVVAAYGDYDGSPLESGSERQLLVCELRR